MDKHLHSMAPVHGPGKYEEPVELLSSRISGTVLPTGPNGRDESTDGNALSRKKLMLNGLWY